MEKMSEHLTLAQADYWAKRLLCPRGWPVISLSHSEDGVELAIGGLHRSGVSYPRLRKAASYETIAAFRQNELARRTTR